jgi:hypothetical protein
VVRVDSERYVALSVLGYLIIDKRNRLEVRRDKEGEREGGEDRRTDSGHVKSIQESLYRSINFMIVLFEF